MASPVELALPEASESIESRTPEIHRVSPALFETAQAIESVNIQRRPLISNPFNEDVVVGVSSTTFGFDLGTGIGSTRVADHAVSVPLVNSGGVYAGSVELIGGPAFGDEVLDGVSRALVIAALIAVLLAAGAGWLISREITRPVLLLAQATGQMASGDLSARVQLLRRDEFGSLAHSFNNMAARVEDTVSTLRRFVADAAHELQTPLTALRADLELALSEGDDSERSRFTQRALGQVSRLSVLADGLLDLSRIESGTSDAQRQAIDLTALVAEMSEVYASRAEQAGIYFEVELPADPVILQVRETQIRRAVGNLLDNAIKFTPENGSIRLRLKHHAKNVEISVNDTGIGIAPDDLPQLFHRFHRGRNAASYPGSGLGLAIIKAIIDGHHGEIFVHSSGTGTQFTIQLPAAI
jgi:two-component system sensor histidine kinase BaeS